ncbi:MAG: hypothetical protein ACYC61_21050 [Isosphaeraceae bacterium]
MRRLRDAGIVALLLLGMTGCAGVQQRLGWTEPPYLGDEDQDPAHPMSRLAFWRRHRTDESSAAPAREVAGTSRQLIAGRIVRDDEDDDRPGLLRRMPLVGRMFRHEDHDETDAISYPSARPVPASAGTVAASTPTQPALAAAPIQVSTAARPAAPAMADTIRVASQPARELSVDLAGTKPEVDAAAVPVANADADVPPPLNPAPAAAMPRQDGTPPPPAVPTLPAPGAAPANPPQAPPELTPTNPTTPITNRGPALPSATIGPEPEIAPGPKPAPEPWPPSTVTSTPGPVWPDSESSSFVSSGQGIVTTSPQSGYVSTGCDSGCGGKCKTHKLCPLKKHKQRAVYDTVLPSSQSVVSGCEAPCKVKKPCFLKTWLHHKSGCKSKGCKGCKSCTYCGEAPAMVSEQGLASSQY